MMHCNDRTCMTLLTQTSMLQFQQLGIKDEHKFDGIGIVITEAIYQNL